MSLRNTVNCKNTELILEAMNLADKMLSISELGAESCDNDSCRLIFGVIRDCGYKIRRAVEEEQLEELFECDNSKLMH